MYKHYPVLYLGRHMLFNLLPTFQVAEHHVLHAPNTMEKMKAKNCNHLPASIGTELGHIWL